MSLKLLATDADDLAVLAAMTQDALVPVGEMVFVAEEKKFYAALNRFCWEEEKRRPYQRTHSALCIENVENIQLHNIDLSGHDVVLDLLTVFYDDKFVFLRFAGHRDIRLKVTAVTCRLNDFGEAWTTKIRPRHE